MGEFEKSICELFDNCPSASQIKAIAGMYSIDVGEVRDILKKNGRELPKGGRPKSIKEAVKAAEEKKDVPPETEPQKAADDKEQRSLIIPDAVKNLVFGRLDELDGNITDINQRIDALEKAKADAVAEFKVLAGFIQEPFGAGNLSQESSDNMIESPQADA